MTPADGSRPGLDIRLLEAAVLFAELARMLDASASSLSPDEARVVSFIRDARSRSIVAYIPRA
jgi:hypothetical protein